MLRLGDPFSKRQLQEVPVLRPDTEAQHAAIGGRELLWPKGIQSEIAFEPFQKTMRTYH